MFLVCLPPQLAFYHLSPVQITWYKSWKILWKKTVVDAWTFTGNTSGRSGIYGPWAGYYGIVVFWLVGFNWLGYLNTFWLLNPHFTVSLLALPICFTSDKWRSRKKFTPGKRRYWWRGRASIFKVSETYPLTTKSLFLFLCDS